MISALQFYQGLLFVTDILTNTQIAFFLVHGGLLHIADAMFSLGLILLSCRWLRKIVGQSRNCKHYQDHARSVAACKLPVHVHAYTYVRVCLFRLYNVSVWPVIDTACITGLSYNSWHLQVVQLCTRTGTCMTLIATNISLHVHVHVCIYGKQINILKYQH